MTLCLYECLRAVGLQHLYARFASMGVCHTPHLSVLTMEDYPLLGIHTMEDRTRFFQLVQFIKTLDLDDDDDDDDDDYGYSLSGCDEGGTIDCHNSYGTSHDEDSNGAAASNLIASTSARPSHVCRRLDFSNETSHHHHHQRSSHPVVHVNVSHARYEELIQGKGCATSVRHHYKPNSKPATVASRTFNHKPLGHKDRKGATKKKNLHAEMSTDRCKATPVFEAKRTAGYNYGLPLSTPPPQSKQQSEEQRIKVCVRKRPLTCAESRRGEADVVTTPGGECVIVHEGKEAVDLSQYILQHKFYFDQVFGEESSNEEVYRKTAYPLVQHMLKGGKVTCFAYGQTGAGKTHTMLGSPTRPGLYALAVQDIFAHLATTHSSQLVYVSFFEIYCGQLYDLLDHRKRLYAREDGRRMVHISGLRDVRVNSVSSLLEVISQGTAERTQGMSGVNPLSSRSHALLHIQLRDPNQQIAGRMWFVDLAGSERASDAKEPDRQSRLEGAEINQSLLALKECIRSLDQAQSHTPFRQSKLTQVLKDSFVGDSMTCMIANISPGHTATEHTLNTLRYADRVKELRRQRGLRGRRRNRSKTATSPKHNLFSSTTDSSVSTRGKSPPKKPKLTRQSEAFGPTTTITRSPVGSAFLCSTPKISKCGDEADARSREKIGLEHIAPVRGWLRMGDKRHRSNGADKLEGGRIGNDGYESTERQSVCEQSPGAVLVLGQPKDKQAHSWKVQKEGEAREADLSYTERKSEFCSREEENEQHILKGGIEKGQKSRDANSKGERLRHRELPNANERDKERERHLRWYHKQLQQFIPSSVSSSIHLSSPSTYPSSSSPSSTRGSVFNLSISSHMSHSLEQVLDGYTARSEVRADGNRGRVLSPSGEIQLQTETSSVSSNINEEDAHGDSDGVWKNSRVSLEGMQAGFGQERSKSEKRKSLEASTEERQRRKEMGPAGMEEGEGRWVWVANRAAGVIPKNFEAQLSRSCDSQDRLEVGVTGLDVSDDPADGVQSTEKGGAAQKGCLLSAHNNSNGNNLISNPPFEPPHQRAPAERPLSPPCEHISTLLTSDMLSDVSFESKHPRSIPDAAPSNSHREKELWFNATVNKRPFLHVQSATLPLTTSITPPEPLNKLPENPAHTQVHNHSDVKMIASPQNETQADSFSSIMEPLSISQLQVDRQVATVSFLQGENSNTKVSPLKNESGKENKRDEVEKVVEDENVGLQLCFVELPQVKTHHHPLSDTMTDTNHTEGKQDIQVTNCYTGIPEGFLGSLQDQESSQKQTPATLLNKPAASPLKKSTCAAMQVFLPSLHDLITKDAQVPPEYVHNDHKKTPLPSIITPQLESDSGHTLPSQCHAVHSKHVYKLTTLLQPNNLGEESTSNHQIRPTIHLFNLDDLDHARWCIFKAHWEQLKEMEALCLKEGKLLCQQPDMAFGEYVHKLEEIMEKKAWCVHRIRAQLQPYLKPVPSNHPQGGDNHSSTS
ncbi:kinesin-like protein KIF24 isoform X2 [Archocentrus centrarchus]|uniref:kinesin-like protein KIF24 isoform X2 n=1 Tax=Archocentrus centrarchus TaxID=63155 RepID=UPI0011E9B981|nr:kinesin-like protein KIF24 isoform X2 [Archocentrus centrarchus]